MANQFQHKRSSTTTNVPTLAAGELAFNLVDKRVFTANSTVVFDAFQNTTSNIAISNSSGILFIGNSTINLIINSTSVTLANSTVSFSVTRPTAAEQAGNYYLHANGSWALVAGGGGGGTPGGANTQIQYNDSNTFAGSAGLTFNNTTNAVTIANSLTVGASLLVGNSTVNAVANATGIYFNDQPITPVTGLIIAINSGIFLT